MSGKSVSSDPLLARFELGNSFFELIEFSLMRRLLGKPAIVGVYGVNVAKVREVVLRPEINPLASRVEGLAGVFELRGVPIPAINLNQILGDADHDVSENKQIIVTEFSNKRAGFLVHSTNRIRRVSWDRVLPPSSDSNSCISGMVLAEHNQFLFVLDLEKILAEIEARSMHGSQPYGVRRSFDGSPSDGPYSEARWERGSRQSSGKVILLVDDSPLILDNVAGYMRKKGFELVLAQNGIEGLKKLQEIFGGRHPLVKKVDVIVSDVEMPLMDGLTFIGEVRKNQMWASLPIIVHTSLNSRGTEAAAERLGISGFVLKNDVKKLLSFITEVVSDGVKSA